MRALALRIVQPWRQLGDLPFSVWATCITPLINRAGTMALPFRALKRCTINSSTHTPVETFAMQPGMVSPFLHPERAAHLSALVLLPWRERRDAKAREVAISLSLWESLALPVRCMRPLVRQCARRAYPQGASHRTGHRRRYPILCRGG